MIFPSLPVNPLTPLGIAVNRIQMCIRDRFKGQSTWNNLALVLIGLLFVSIFPAGSEGIPIRAFGILVLSLVYGVLFTIRVGGADMPITISLLNSFSGVAASISGFAVRNPLLVLSLIHI